MAGKRTGQDLPPSQLSLYSLSLSFLAPYHICLYLDYLSWKQKVTNISKRWLTALSVRRQERNRETALSSAVHAHDLSLLSSPDPPPSEHRHTKSSMFDDINIDTSFKAASRSVRAQTQDVYARLRSIDADARFVRSVQAANNGLPLVGESCARLVS